MRWWLGGSAGRRTLAVDEAATARSRSSVPAGIDSLYSEVVEHRQTRDLEPEAPAVKAGYPDDWDEIAGRIKESAGWCCEACGVEHGPVPRILTVHHLDRDRVNCELENLVALCQRCHLRAEAWALAGELLSREVAIDRLRRIAEEERRQTELPLYASNSRWISAFGELRTLSEWSELAELAPSTIHERLSRGWTPERAVSEPSHTTGRGGLRR
jgi:hypothetical protein